jgi:nucleoside-diphosphate-sugar epimerase
VNDSILLTGASGFHGRQILQALIRRGTAPLAILLRDPARFAVPEHVSVVPGSLSNRQAVRAALLGVRTVIHSASYVGYDPRLCAEVNVDGTALLLEEAARAGVSDLIYISTSAVYGPGPHRGVRADSAIDALTSALSQSRRDAERIVLEAGGRVIRPALVFGAGDKWVVPAIIAVIDRLGGAPEGGRARQSVINVRDLGELIAGVTNAVREGDSEVPLVLNAANAEPMTLSEILRVLAERGIRSPSSLASIPLERAEQIAETVGLSVSHVRSFGIDNWIDAEPAWSAAELPTPSDLGFEKAEALYYRELLRR